MTRTVLDELRTIEGTAEGGPVRWHQAWSRAIKVLTPAMVRETYYQGTDLVDGGAALAMALYLVAEAEDVDPQIVTREQVEALLDRGTGTDGDVLARWVEKLTALGHDTSAGAYSGPDPVAASWRRLRVDHDDRYTTAYDMDSTARHGWGFISGLRTILAPRLELNF